MFISSLNCVFQVNSYYNDSILYTLIAIIAQKITRTKINKSLKIIIKCIMTIDNSEILIKINCSKYIHKLLNVICFKCYLNQNK